MVRLINDSGVLGKKITDLSGVSFGDMIEAIHKIQTNMGIAGATGEEAAKTLEGSWNAVKAQFDNILTNVGEGLTPALQALSTQLSTWMQSVDWDKFSKKIGDAFSGITQAIKGIDFSSFFTGALNVTEDLIDAFSGVAKVVGTVISWFGKCKGSADLVIGAFTGLVAGMEAFKTASAIAAGVQAIVTAFTALTPAADGAAVAQEGVNVAMDANPFILIASVIAGVIAAVVMFVSTNKNAQAVLTSCWNAITGVLSGFGSWVVSLFTKDIPAAYSACTGAIRGFVSSVTGFFGGLLGNIGSFVSNAIKTVSSWVGNLTASGRSAGSGFLNAVTSFFTQLPSNIGKFLSSAWKNITSWAGNIGKSALSAGISFVQNVGSGMSSLASKVNSHCQSAMKNVNTWVNNMLAKASKAGSGFVSGTSGNMKRLPSTISTHLSSAVSKAVAFAGNFAKQAESAGSRFFRGIYNHLKGLPSQVAGIGSNIVSSIGQGITNRLRGLLSTVSSMGAQIVNTAKKALHINSPSKIFMNEIGGGIIEGLSLGLTSNAHIAYNSMQGVAENLVKRTRPIKTAVQASLYGLDSNTGTVSNSGSTVKTVNYTQNLYSPKELSRKEIYRQTKTALSFVGVQ